MCIIYQIGLPRCINNKHHAASGDVAPLVAGQSSDEWCHISLNGLTAHTMRQSRIPLSSSSCERREAQSAPLSEDFAMKETVPIGDH